eukprot:COSAG05_NODE_8_length_40675_cov_148.837539_1_plen_865_part_10
MLVLTDSFFVPCPVCLQIDLDNDEVRIYLTSSQEHFQQDDVNGEIVFEQRRNHRTQLQIYTNDINNDGVVDTGSTTGSTGGFALYGSDQTTAWMETAEDTIGSFPAAADSAAAAGQFTGAGSVELPLGPLPYVYKSFSTVGGNVPTQQSPLMNADLTLTPDGTQLAVVCPVCTHPAYCTLYDGVSHTLVTGTAADTQARACEDGVTTGGCGDTYAGDDGTALDQGKRVIEGSVITFDKTTIGGDVAMPDTEPYYNRPTFQGCYQVKITYAPVMDMCAKDPSKVVSDLNPLEGRCSKTQDGFTIYDGLLPRQAGGSHPQAVGWSYESPVPFVHTKPGNSDFRIDEIGDQVLRTRSDPRPLCRYANCPELTVNGGDQQPESKNFLYPDYDCAPTEVLNNNNNVAIACGSSWRGDLSSSAQLVFDSTNWDIPQKVTVHARADDVYEPEVNNRGQDAYVHHFVVAQDANLEHTYYDDIEVNDLTVSITDDDPAVVIENMNDVNPNEDGSDTLISLRLASEPMYPVTVYLQSGPFFTPGEEPMCGTVTDGNQVGECNFLPDDEQVIFQDVYQSETCWTLDSTVRTYTYDLVQDQPASYRAAASDINHGGTYNYQGCFEKSDSTYQLVDAPIDLRQPSPDTRQIEATMQCHGDDRCERKIVPLPNGAYPRDNFHESRQAEVTGSSCKISSCTNVGNAYDEIGHYVETGQVTGSFYGASDTADSGTTTSTPIGDAGSNAAVALGSSQRTCKDDGLYLGLRSYSSGGASNLPTTGYTCNSYVTFSTTNWNTWQKLKVIGVDDNLDEGAYRISEVGFLYESIDWYYNSAGASLMTERNLAYQPTEDNVASTDATASVELSMFDTRFGKHINRYP